MTTPSYQVLRQPPGRGIDDLGIAGIWRYRELLQILVWRNVAVRYKQSVIGIGWAVLRPVVSMVVLAIVFGHLLNISTGDTPRAIFYYSGLLPWLYFATTLSSASGSLVSGAGIATKARFPRLILPISYLFTGLVDLVLSMFVFAGMMIWHRDSITLSWTILTVPLFVALAMLTAFSISLWLAALMVRYRDVAHVIPFLTQVGMYFCPVIYPMETVAGGLSSGWQLLYSTNPMVAVIEGFRWAMLGGNPPDVSAMTVGITVMLGILAGGLVIFRRVERELADIV